MGFHNGAYATVWSVEDKGRYSLVQLSISDKNRDGEYETSWSSYVTFAGGKCTAHQMVKDLGLKRGDRIRITSTDERSTYNKETKEKRFYHTVFEFEPVENNGGQKQGGKTEQPRKASAEDAAVGSDDPF